MKGVNHQVGTPARSLARLLTAAALLGAAAPASAHHIDQRFPVASHPVVAVHNAVGTIIIRSWQKPEVQVVADHTSDKVEVDAVLKGNIVDVRTHVLSEDAAPGDLQADYQITVPEETHLQIHNDSGRIAVDRIVGDVTLETVGAHIQLQRVSGYVYAKTVGGSFTCAECTGRIEANSISGSIAIIRAESSNVRVQTSSGNILLDSDLLPNGMYHLKNYTGQIELRFSPGDSFDLTAISVKGKVESEAKLKPPDHVNRRLSPGLATSLLGTYNEGKARVELTSFSGKIYIRKRE